MENPRQVYKEIFDQLPNYNTFSSNSGLSYQLVLNSLSEIRNVRHCLDIGSGRGLMIRYLHENRPEIEVSSVDLEKFHDFDVNFTTVDLSKPNPLGAVSRVYDLATCLDVMEHLPPEVLDRVFESISRISVLQAFTIANHSDVINGVELHLTQENISFWRQKILQYFDIFEEQSFNFSGNELYYFFSGTKLNQNP